MKKYLSIILVLLVGSFFIFGNKMAAGEKVLISAHPEFPPVMYKDKEMAIVGVGPELTERILSELGIEVQSEFVGPWVRVQELAKKGEIDLIAGIYKNEEREKYLDYIPTPFMTNPVVIYVKKGNAFPFKKWDDLKGRKGGAIIADKFMPEFEEFLLKNKDTIRMEMVTSLEQNFLKLIKGRIDFIPYSKYVGMIKLEELELRDQVEILPEPVYSGLFYLAISKKNKSNLKKYIPVVDQKIVEYQEDGTIEKLIEKYIKEYVDMIKEE